MRERDFRGDCPSHRVTDQHGTRNAERVEQRHDEVRIRRIGIPVCRFVGESKTTIVDYHDAVARRDERRQLVSPAVHRRAEPVNENDRRAVAGIDQPEPRSIDGSVLRAKRSAGGVALRFGNGGRAAPRHDQRETAKA